MIVQTRFLNERLPAHFANFSPITCMDSLVKSQCSFPNKSFPTKLTLMIFRCFMFKFMFIHSFEAKRLVFTKLTGITFTEHMKIVYVFPELHFCVERSFTRIALEPIIDIMLF